MKRLGVFFSILLMASGAFGQTITVSDNFSDGDFTQNPEWVGNTTNFTVNSSKQLQLNASAAGTSILATQAAIMGDIEWSFWVKLDFAPSDNNNTRIYLLSDSNDLTGSLNGYYIKLGENNANDPIELFKQSGGTSTSLCRGTAGRVAAAFAIRIKVTRSAAGEWNIYVDSAGGTNYQLDATASDLTFTSGSWFGVYCKYTASNITKFHFDDINITGDAFVDNTPPTASTSVESPNQLKITFSEAINSISENNFSLSNDYGNPTSVAFSAGNTVATLTFANDFIPADYILTITGVTDLAGNTLLVTDYPFNIQTLIYLVQDNFLDGNFTSNPTWSGNDDSFEIEEGVLHSINEVANSRFYLSTPSNIVNNCEWDFGVTLQFNPSSANYVDLFLMSDKADLGVASNGYFVRIGDTKDDISLYRLMNGSSTKIIDGEDGVVSHTSNVLKIRVVRAADNSWSLQYDLTGTGESFVIAGTTVDDAPVLNSSYLGILIAQSTSSFFKKHYFDDIYAGPVIPDTTPPTVRGVSVKDGYKVIVVFSEPTQQATVNDFTVEGLHPTSIIQSADRQTDTLIFANNFELGKIYTLKINNIADLEGNFLADSDYHFGVTEQPVIGDLIFNEIMFDNPDGAEEYIEIYNKSNKILDISTVNVATLGKKFGTRYHIPTGTTMLPKSYLALCKTPLKEQTYFACPDTANFAAMSIPSLNNDGATLVLCTDTTYIFDQVTYSSKWHNPMVKNHKGVALERINPDLPTNNSGTWTSAAAPHYGTPGYKNSQYTDISSSQTNKEVWIDDEVFTPNSDGVNDVLLIHYKFNESGWTANITIFDASGAKVKKYPSNTILATEGVLTWDGSTDSGKSANIGIYVVYLDMFNKSTGDTKRFKLATVVSGSR